MPGTHEHLFPNFTPEARQLWAKVPEEIREKLLANVYCSWGCMTTTIVDYHGFCERGTVVLQGRCKRCNGEVARVID